MFQDKIGYSARAVTSVSLIVINLIDLTYIWMKNKDLKRQVDKVKARYMDEFDRPRLDYTRRSFFELGYE